MAEGNCRFNGTGRDYFSTVFVHLFLLNILSLGIYSAWAWARLLRLKASHTTVRGQTVQFTGSGLDLFKLAIAYGLLTVVTLGLYGPWAICKVLEWRARNTLVGGRASRFTGTGGSLFLFYLVHLMILPLLTFGLYYFYGMYRFYAWKEERTLYGGEKTSFGAPFLDFLKIALISWVLNTLTLNLFTPWSLCMLYRWQIQGLMVGDSPGIFHFAEVKTSPAMVLACVAIGILPYLFVGWFAKVQIERMTAVMRAAGVQSSLHRRPPGPAHTGPRAEKPLLPDEIPGPPEGTSPAAPDSTEWETATLSDLIGKNPQDADLYYNRGWLYATRGDSQKAIEDYSKAIALNKSFADALYNRALVHVRLQEYQNALADLSAVIQLQPDASDAYCNRGNVHFQMHRKELALQDYAKALEIKPDDADVLMNREMVLKTCPTEEPKKGSN